MKNSYFDRLVNYVGNTYLFQRYVSTWAPPFDNASFDAALVMILFGVLIWTGFGIIMNIIYHYRARKKQAMIRSEREQYLLFLKEQEADKSKEEGLKPDRELDAQSIKKKYEKDLEASELVDSTGDEKVVSIAESSIIRELEPNTEEFEPEDKEPIDVGKLLAEKTTETEEDEESQDGSSDFGELIENLRLKQKQEARAKELECAAREAAEHNLEILRSDMENAISENRQEAKKENKKTADISVISDAQKKALRAREKERLRMQKRRKCQ